jgi:hypothetical protein
MMLLAYATDLATGQSRDFALRSCVLSMRLADALGLDPGERREVYHQAILRYIGCNADTHILASTFGDEMAMRRDMAVADLGNHAELGGVFVRAFERVFADLPPERLRQAVAEGLSEAFQKGVPILAGHCEVARRIGERIGLDESMLDNLGMLYERFDGRGLPRGIGGDAVRRPVQLVTLAQDAIALAEARGFDAMTEALRKRRDCAYRADLVDVCLADAAALMRGLDGVVDRDTILALEPEPHVWLGAEACEEAFVAIADMVDMRMPFTYGHSRAVAVLAEAAARCLGMPEPDIRNIR